jgi:hypothetical protein
MEYGFDESGKPYMYSLAILHGVYARDNIYFIIFLK